MLMKATEAREMSKDGESQGTKEQLLAAEKAIAKGVKNGAYSCYCYKYLETQAITKLQELGYKVQNESSQRDGVMFLISW